MLERTTLVGARERQAALDSAGSDARVEVDDLGGRSLQSVAIRLTECGGRASRVESARLPCLRTATGCGPTASSGRLAPYSAGGLASVSLCRGIDHGAVGTR